MEPLLEIHAVIGSQIVEMQGSMIMNNKFYLIFCALFLLPGCFFNSKSNNETKHTLLIQAIFDSSTLTSIRKAIIPLINDIVKEELGLTKESEPKFFSPKKIHRLTLYYVNDIYENGEETLFSALDTLEKKKYELVMKNITIAPDVHFFGTSEKDELVIMVNDPDKKLSRLNDEMKEVAHQANVQYKKKYRHDLYDITKSEQYPFTPHIGLGRVRSNFIKEELTKQKKESQFDVVFQNIQERVQKAVLKVVKEHVSSGDQKLPIDKISILDLQKQEYIHILKKYK